MMYYKDGFYPEQSEENDRAEITDEYFACLLEQQAKGMEICPDENRYPIVREVVKTQYDNCVDELNELETWFSSVYDVQMQQYERCVRLGIEFTSKYGTVDELDAQAVTKAARIKELRAFIEEANA